MTYVRISEADIDIFNKPARLLISGYSGSGKSTLVKEIVAKYRNKFEKVIILGADLEDSSKLNVTHDNDFNPFEEHLTGKTLLIFDDVIYNKKLLILAGEVFVRGRHLNVSSIFLTQNLFLSNTNFRQITLNTTHIIILRHRDEKQILCFARSFLSDDKVKKFLNLYKKIVTKQKHQHLLIDFTVDIDSPTAIRSSVVGGDYQKVFILD